MARFLFEGRAILNVNVSCVDTDCRTWEINEDRFIGFDSNIDIGPNGYALLAGLVGTPLAALGVNAIAIVGAGVYGLGNAAYQYSRVKSEIIDALYAVGPTAICKYGVPSFPIADITK